MAYQEITNVSWFGRVGQSIKGVIVGIVFFCGSTITLYINEGNFVKVRGTINEAQSILVPIDDVSSVDDMLHGKLIHATASAQTQETLHDSQFGIDINAIALNRKSRYYQWVEDQEEETREKLGGGKETITTYTYEKRWVDEPVNSNDFRDSEYQGRNTTKMTVDNETFYADNVSFGDYKLPRFLVEEIDDNKKINVTPTKSVENMKTSGNIIYIGDDMNQPTIGDVKISYTIAPPSEISIIAQVNKNTFEAFISQSNDREFSRLSMGKKSHINMIAEAHDENNFFLWLIRIIAFVFCVAGFAMILGPLSIILRIIPFVGGLVEFLSTGVAILLGFSWSLMVIAISWLRFRPLIGGGILLVAIAIAFIALYWKKKRAVPQMIKETKIENKASVIER